MKECDDSEHYDWVKCDTTDAGQRKLIEVWLLFAATTNTCTHHRSTSRPMLSRASPCSTAATSSRRTQPAACDRINELLTNQPNCCRLAVAHVSRAVSNKCSIFASELSA